MENGNLNLFCKNIPKKLKFLCRIFLHYNSEESLNIGGKIPGYSTYPRYLCTYAIMEQKKDTFCVENHLINLNFS